MSSVLDIDVDIASGHTFISTFSSLLTDFRCFNALANWIWLFMTRTAVVVMSVVDNSDIAIGEVEYLALSQWITCCLCRISCIVLFIVSNLVSYYWIWLCTEVDLRASQSWNLCSFALFFHILFYVWSEPLLSWSCLSRYSIWSHWLDTTQTLFWFLLILYFVQRCTDIHCSTEIGFDRLILRSLSGCLLSSYLTRT